MYNTDIIYMCGHICISMFMHDSFFLVRKAGAAWNAATCNWMVKVMRESIDYKTSMITDKCPLRGLLFYWFPFPSRLPFRKSAAHRDKSRDRNVSNQSGTSSNLSDSGISVSLTHYTCNLMVKVMVKRTTAAPPTPLADVNRRSICDEYSGSTKISTHLDHISHREIACGTHQSKRWTYRVFVINTRREYIPRTPLHYRCRAFRQRLTRL